MAVAASEIIDRVRALLVDEDTTQRWTDEELLRHLSDGQRTIAAMNSDWATKVAVMQLAVGTRQSLPADGLTLLGVTRNMGLTPGNTPGRAVRLTRREILDDQEPNWHAATKVTAIYNYIYDPLDATAFFVYPPSNGNGFIEINYTFNPPEITALTDEISLQDILQTPLMDYVMFRAHMKDSDWAGGMNTAQFYLQAFQVFMSGSDQSDTETNPNIQLGPFSPTPKAAAK